MILGYYHSSKGGVKKIAKGALVVMKRQEVDKLYKLVGNKVVGGVLVTDSADDTKLWHMELGHIGEFGMLKLPKKKLLNGVKIQAKLLQLLCVLEAPQSQFQDTHTSKGVLDYTHSNVWGRFH